MDVNAFFEFLTETQVLGVTLAEICGKLLLVAIVAAIAGIFQRVLVRVVQRVLERAEVPSASILVNILRVVVWTLALMTVLEPVFGVQPTAFVAALGVGSLALSMGMQDTVSNVIGGLTLMMTKQIEPGDTVRMGDFTGVVTDLNWRSTSLRDAYGQVSIIPNSVLSKATMVKVSAYVRSRCQVSMVIKHGTDINDVLADVARVARDELGTRVDKRMDVEVLLEGFDPAGIQAKANVHLVKGTNVDEARTLLVQNLVECPWAVRLA